MRTRRIAALVLAAFVSSTVPTTLTRTAAAQADDPVTTQARQRFKEGVEFYDKGKYEEARLSFLQAYTLKKHPAVLLNLAQSTAKAGHAAEAARYFKQFLKESTTASPQQRKDAETGLADARQKLGRIEVIAPAGTEITLDDGEKIGTTPLAEPIDVEPGPHTVKSPTDSVKVVATLGQKVEAKLGQPAAATPPPVVPVTAPPATKEAMPPSGTGTDTTQPPAETTPPPAAEKGPKRTSLLTPPETMVPVYAGLAAAGVGLVGAIVFAAFKADAQSKADAVANDIRRAAQLRGIPSQGVCSSTNPTIQKDFGSACTTLQDNNDKVDTNATIANVSLVVMGVGLVTAAGWYLFAPKREEAKAAKATVPTTKPVITPYAGWGSGGLSVSGAF